MPSGNAHVVERAAAQWRLLVVGDGVQESLQECVADRVDGVAEDAVSPEPRPDQPNRSAPAVQWSAQTPSRPS
ncbi:MAG: hypothetical protein ACRDRG_14840 [Pseudonocardiaceae bacterium]